MTSVVSPHGYRFSIQDDLELPSITDLVAGHAGATPVTTGEPVSRQLVTTYFDTPDHRLADARMRLGRRTGADDAGWHLDVPGATDGAVRLPLGRSTVTVPAVLRELVRVRTRGDALRPIARTTTSRTTHTLLDASGLEAVRLVDDRLQTERLGGIPGAITGSSVGGTASCRALRLESESAEEEWLDAALAALVDAGVTEADPQDELARVGVEGPEVQRESRGGRSKHPSPDSPAGEVVLRYVRRQVEQVFAYDPLVRLDVHESVHQMRVATRRLRSSLQTFRPVLQPDAVESLRSELTWLAGELGAARDAEVMRDRMLAALHEEEARIPTDAAGSTTDTEMSTAYRAAHDDLVVALKSDRYHRLVDALHRLVTEPPLTPKAERRAGRVLPRRAARAYRRLDALVATVHEASTLAERDTRLHEARKAAKRARYAGETMVEFFGKPAARFAAAMEEVQEELGEHQDSVVMRARIEELAEGDITPAAAFAYGRLHAHEERRGDLAVERFEKSWRSASKKSLRAWTT